MGTGGTRRGRDARLRHYVALIQFALGDVVRGHESLSTAVALRSRQIAYIRADPALAFLRSDPRFAALRRRVAPFSSGRSSPDS